MRRRYRRMSVAAAAAAVVASVLAPTTSADPVMTHVSRLVPTASWLSAHVGGHQRLAPYHPLIAPDAISGAGAPIVSGPAIQVQVLPDTAGRPLPGGFVGLSIEFPTLEQYLGRDPRAIDPVFLSLVRGVDPGQAPVLRIGGDSTDRTWWPVAGMRRPAGVRFSLSRRWLRVARALAARLHAHLIVGVDLAANRIRLAAVEARNLVRGIGASRIAGLEIGNEPDLYRLVAWYRRDGARVFSRPPTYDATHYLKQYRRFSRVMPRGARLAGPAFAKPAWMARLRRFLRDARGLRVVTFHRYPLRACEHDPASPAYPTIPNLLSEASTEGLARGVVSFAATAHAAKLPFRLDELNSASCEGAPGVSNTFASALWMLNVLFDVARAGVDGVNVHMLPGSAYQAFSVGEPGGRWSAYVAPLYYGMLMFSRAFPRGARQLVVQAPADEVKAYATRSRRGRLRIVLINEDPSRSLEVELRVPGAQTPLTVQRLTAPSLEATSGVSLDGESFGARTRTGVLPVNRHSSSVPFLLGHYTVPLPAASAVLLTR